MKKIIIDSSVAIKWFSSVNEQKAGGALRVLELVKGREIKAICPTFILVEVINILFHKKGFGKARVLKVYKEILDSGINFIDIGLGDLQDVIILISSYSTSSYDTLYLLLAKKEKCKLLTFDRELLKIKGLTIGVDQLLKDF